MSHYFLLQEGKETGPFEPSSIRTMRHQHLVSGNTPCRVEGGNWLPLEGLREQLRRDSRSAVAHAFSPAPSRRSHHQHPDGPWPIRHPQGSRLNSRLGWAAIIVAVLYGFSVLQNEAETTKAILAAGVCGLMCIVFLGLSALRRLSSALENRGHHRHHARCA